MARGANQLREPHTGELNRRITLRLRSDVPASDMGLEPVFSEPRKRWAKIEPVGTAIYANGVQTDNKLTHRITLRYHPGITDEHEIVHGETLYRVKRIADLNGAHRFTVLEVEELGQLKNGVEIYV
jgi:SPP1 family predicted phage head-tail adaptor